MHDSKKTTPAEEDKVAEGAATTNSQSDQQQSDTDTSSTQVDGQRYATNGDVLEAKDEIIDKMDAGFERLDKTMDAGFERLDKTMDAGFTDVRKEMKDGFEKLDKKNDKTRKEMSSQFKESARFIIGTLIGFISLLIGVMAAIAAILTYLK